MIWNCGERPFESFDTNFVVTCGLDEILQVKVNDVGRHFPGVGNDGAPALRRAGCNSGG